jgi:hypothetical protein
MENWNVSFEGRSQSVCPNKQFFKNQKLRRKYNKNLLHKVIEIIATTSVG